MPIHTHPSRNNKKNFVQKKFNPFYKRVIKELLRIKKNGHGKITFYYRDGSMQSTPFSQELFTDEKGSERRFGDIIAILNDLKHDFRAESFKIT